MNSNKGIIIQARMGSTRLPNKILLPFYNDKGCIELLIDRIKEKIDIPIIIATSTSEKDNQIEVLANKLNVLCFRGYEQNVLKRFIDCAETYKLDVIIRICSDNPFLDVESLINLVNSSNVCDYESFWINESPTIKTHFGFWAEKVNKNALVKALSLTEDAFYHEHVTNFIYGNPELFKCHFNRINNEELSNLKIRLTLDTQNDFNTLSKLYQKMIKNDLIFSIDTILHEIKKDQNYLIDMESEIINNTK